MRLASIFTIVVLLFGGSSSASAQYSLTVDPQLSLAWWQINPHLSHLWATTCPGDPSWRAGDGGKGIGWAQQYLSMRSKTGYANVKDTIIPLYPRRRARALCEQAVSGNLTATDTTNWTGIRGSITVQANKLTTGMAMRDKYARESILNTAAYPTIKFTIDSISPLAKARRGENLEGTVYGVLELHGVSRPIEAPVKTWRDPAGRRVTTKFMIPAGDMVDVYRMSKYSLGLGVGGTVWEELWVGVDVILKPAGAAMGQT